MDRLLTSLDPMLLFKKLEERKIARESNEGDMAIKESPVNSLSRRLHPSFQQMIISSVKENKGAKTFRLVPDEGRGCKECAVFLPGEYIAVYVDINGVHTSRPYSLSSTPLDALNGFYEITVKSVPGGFVSSYILSSWHEGLRVTVSGPQGHFSYNPIRDTSSLLCIAGGSGITPFMSFIKAFGDKTPITLLYGSRKKDETLFLDELEEMEKKYPLLRCVFVFSDEEREGYEHGFISGTIIEKYMPSQDSSIFICGPEKMIEYVDNELSSIRIGKRRIRHDTMNVAASSPVEKRVEVKVVSDGVETLVSGSSGETLLSILERGGIKAPSSCRSGECGFCRSLLKKGEVYIPQSVDKRRRKDRDYGYIHPCITYPMGDVEIEIFPPEGLYKED